MRTSLAAAQFQLISCSHKFVGFVSILQRQRDITPTNLLSDAGAVARVTPQIVRGAPDHLRVGAGGEAEQEQLAEYAQRHARDAAKLMQRMPRELLLLLKTNDCLRSVDRELGQVGARP